MSIIPSFFGRKGSKGTALEPITLDIWDPLESFSLAVASPVSARMDWKETPEAHVFIAEVPGLKKDEVKIEVEEEKILKISGERKKESEEKNEKWHRVERTSDRFVKTVRLPSNVKVEAVKANLENGVLTVTVPKGQDKEHGGRLIQIAG